MPGKNSKLCRAQKIKTRGDGTVIVPQKPLRLAQNLKEIHDHL